MYVLMEKISRDAMRVDVPAVNPAGIDGTYIVKVRSSAALRRLCFASAELDREERTERGPTDRRKWHGQAWASTAPAPGSAFSASCERAACGPDRSLGPG